MSEKRMRVMHVVGADGPGGAQMFYLRLLESLRKQVDVFPVVRHDSWMMERLKERDIPFQAAPFGGFFDRTTTKLLTEYIKQNHPDVIQGWMNRGNKFMPKTDIPTVGRMGGYYNLKYYKNDDYIVGNTELICDYVRKQGKAADKVRYIPNFVPQPSEFYTSDREQVRMRYHIPLSAKVLLVAGRLHDCKGVDMALYAMRQLPSDVHLIIAGEGDMEEDLRTSAEGDGLKDRVHFVGWIPQITPVVSACDIWIVPSRFEPLGNVVLDAWMHKKPVVATATDGPASLIDEGENGLLVPVEDEFELAKAVKCLLDDEDLSAQVSEKGFEKAMNFFSEEIVVNQYLDFYREIIAAGK